MSIVSVTVKSNCHILQVLHQDCPETWHNFLYVLTSSKIKLINCFSLITPLVSGVAGLSASSSSKANTLNI